MTSLLPLFVAAGLLPAPAPGASAPAVLASGASGPSIPAVKCAPLEVPGHDLRNPLTVVDGAILRVAPGASPTELVQGMAVHSVNVDCWDPETGAFGANPGVQVVRILSRSRVEAVSAPLLALGGAELRFRERHGRWAASLAELGTAGAGDAGAPSFEGVRFEITPEGWAGVESDGLVTCVLRAQDLPLARGEQAWAPFCREVDGAASAALRSYWEEVRGRRALDPA